MPPNDKHPDEIAKEIELENREWLESLDYVYENQGPDRVRQLLRRLQAQAQRRGVQFHFTAAGPGQAIRVAVRFPQNKVSRCPVSESSWHTVV